MRSSRSLTRLMQSRLEAASSPGGEYCTVAAITMRRHNAVTVDAQRVDGDRLEATVDGDRLEATVTVHRKKLAKEDYFGICWSGEVSIGVRMKSRHLRCLTEGILWLCVAEKLLFASIFVTTAFRQWKTLLTAHKQLQLKNNLLTSRYKHVLCSTLSQISRNYDVQVSCIST